MFHVLPPPSPSATTSPKFPTYLATAPTQVVTDSMTNASSCLDINFKKTTIKSILDRLFAECKTPYQKALAYDTELHDLCLVAAKERGYPIQSPNDPSPSKTAAQGANTINPDRYLRAGVILASAAYGYLPRAHQVYIALYTMLIVWFDDRYAEGVDIDGVEEFGERFMRGQKQQTDGLEAMADLMRRIVDLWPGAVQANIILISTLKFVTGGLLEWKIKGLEVSTSSKSFSAWMRSFTGVAEAYAMFIFPPELETWKYMQAINDICDWINGYNDTVSYYKEEKAGETNNYVSIEAAALGVDKLVILDRLAKDTSTYNQRVESILSPHRGALAVFETFTRGVLLYHTTMEQRYHLGELFL